MAVEEPASRNDRRPASRQDGGINSEVGRRRGFVVATFAFLAVMVGTTMPTPLYPIYEADLGFGSATVTAVYAAYAVGVIAALLLLARASDVLGRRRLMVTAILVSAASSVVFATSPDLAWLYLARVVSGVSAGIVATTGTVYLVELAAPDEQTRAALVATVVNMLGLGLGPVIAGVLSEVAPAPLTTPYVAHLALLAVAALGLLTAPEVVATPGGSWRPLPPTVAAQARAVFVPVAIAGFAAFATLGLVAAVTSGILAQVLGYTDRALTGGVVFTMFLSSVISQLTLRGVATRPALRVGCALLAVGVGVLGLSLPLTSLPLLVAGLAVSGVGQALCFRAGVAALAAQSPPQLRARTVTSFFLVAYVGISAPVVAVGLASRSIGLPRAAETFSVVVAVMAVAALALQLVVTRREVRTS